MAMASKKFTLMGKLLSSAQLNANPLNARFTPKQASVALGRSNAY
jgi:hypothetical protein